MCRAFRVSQPGQPRAGEMDQREAFKRLLTSFVCETGRCTVTFRSVRGVIDRGIGVGHFD